MSRITNATPRKRLRAKTSTDASDGAQAGAEAHQEGIRETLRRDQRAGRGQAQRAQGRRRGAAPVRTVIEPIANCRHRRAACVPRQGRPALREGERPRLGHQPRSRHLRPLATMLELDLELKTHGLKDEARADIHSRLARLIPESRVLPLTPPYLPGRLAWRRARSGEAHISIR
jgi:hypothetical protein